MYQEKTIRNKYDERVGKMFSHYVESQDETNTVDQTSTKERFQRSQNFLSPNHSPNRQSFIFKKLAKRSESVFDYKSEAARRVELIAQKREERRQRLSDEKAFRELSAENNHPYYEYQQMINKCRQQLDNHPLKESDHVVDNQIIVCVRKRPLNDKEIKRKELDVVTVTTKDQLIVHEPKNKVDLTKYLENQNFRFDYVFNENCTTEIVYKFTAQPLIKSIFEGGFATCFAYGQTGSGKTHTMGGDFQGKTQNQNFKNGIYGLVANDVFKMNSQMPYCYKNYQIYASFFEIYGKLAFDLLSKRERLRILEDGNQVVQAVGLTEWAVNKVDDIIHLIKKGSLERSSGKTTANSNSSRSHAIFQITLRKPDSRTIEGRISLIDLAGNERGADTSKSNRRTQLEGADINRSLLALKECIRALGKKGQHCPFRESVLTKILRDSFIGEKTRTCMIALISPNLNSVEHTLNTLRYADRVKELVANDFQTVPGMFDEDEEENEIDENDDDDEDVDEDDKYSKYNKIVVSDVTEPIKGNEYNFNNNDNDLLQSTIKQVMERSKQFHQLASQLYLEHNKFDRYTYGKKWKDILKNFLDYQKDAYIQVSDYCAQFHNDA